VPQTFRASALVPRGFLVDEITSDGASALITVRSIETASICPGCGTRSDRVIAGIIGAWLTCRSPGVRCA
jgi:hypothetical protein